MNGERFRKQGSSEDQPTAQLPNPFPRSIGHYRIISLLGKGGMGEVWLADDTRLKRKVALKLLPSEFTHDAERVRRFEQEARAISALNHPNIITIHEIGECEAGHFLVMELVAGRTLRELAAEQVALDSLIAWVRQVAKALYVAHMEGITHSDIKPENIMVRDDGYVKVLDFGLAQLAAKSFAEAGSLATTNPGVLLGTPSYMAPEQARGEAIAGKPDIFALGILFYELATGEHPFNSATQEDTLQRIMSEMPLPPSLLNPDIPDTVNALILQMLEKEAGERPSAGEVDRALSKLPGQRSSGQFQRPPKPTIKRHTVGREKERAELKARFDAALNGHGLLFCVTGEAGIGKTTLVEDFLAELSIAARCAIARGSCPERLVGTGDYLPVLEALDDLLKGSADLSKAPTRKFGGNFSSEQRAQVMQRLAPTWYARLVSRADTNTIAESRAASPEQLKRELAALLREITSSQPVVLFFDDLHWADDSTIDLLCFLAHQFRALHVLIVVTYRYKEMRRLKHSFLQVKPDLQAHGVCHELALEFLSEAEIAQYLDLEFPDHSFPTEFPKLIHAKTEGSPLFLADLVRCLRDRNVIAQDNGRWTLARALPAIEGELPESARVIEHNIEQLSEEDRELLVVASIQGHEFDSAVVARALKLEADEVEERLEKLERVHEFVRLMTEKEFPNGKLTLRYRFVHVLYQDELYKSLRPRAARRVMFSSEVAHALEDFFGKQRASIANELAALWEKALKHDRAADYWYLAAQNAFAIQEAVRLANRGLAQVEKLPENDERRKIELALQVVLGNALMATKGYAALEVEQTYSRARALCQQLGETPHLLPVQYGLSVNQIVGSKLRQAMKYGEEFLTLAERQEALSIVVAHRMVGIPHFFLGELLQAREHLERSLSLYNTEQHRSLTQDFGMEPGVAGHAFLAFTYWLLGYQDQAKEESQKSLHLGREVQHVHSQTYSPGFAAIHHQFRREQQRVQELADAAIKRAEEHGLAFWLAIGTMMYGWAMTEQGEVANGIAKMRQNLKAYQSTGAEMFCSYYLYLLAEAYGKGGQLDEGLEVLDEAQAMVERNEERFWQAELYRLRSKLLLAKGLSAIEVEAWLHQAIEIAQQQQTKSLELRATMDLARLWQQRGKQAEARQILTKIYGWFTEGFDSADLKDAKVLLDELRPQEERISNLDSEGECSPQE